MSLTRAQYAALAVAAARPDGQVRALTLSNKTIHALVTAGAIERRSGQYYITDAGLRIMASYATPPGPSEGGESRG